MRYRSLCDTRVCHDPAHLNRRTHSVVHVCWCVHHLVSTLWQLFLKQETFSVISYAVGIHHIGHLRTQIPYSLKHTWLWFSHTSHKFSPALNRSYALVKVAVLHSGETTQTLRAQKRWSLQCRLVAEMANRVCSKTAQHSLP